jgi:hypothetical protein
MLTDDLSADLRDLVADPPFSPDIDEVIRRSQRLHRRRNAARASISVVVVAALAAAVSIVVGLATNTEPGLQLAHGGATPVRCDAPTRTVPEYLNWPCGSETATEYFQTGFRDMFAGFERTLAGRGLATARSKVRPALT